MAERQSFMHCVPLSEQACLNYCLHSPPCGLGKDVTLLSNNFDDDNQCRHDTTKIKSTCQHALDNAL